MEAAWVHLRPFFVNACERQRGKIEADDYFELALRGLVQVWVAMVGSESYGVAATEMVAYPRKKVARVTICVGRDRSKWLHLLSEIEDWAKKQGCKGMENIARKGWARDLPDYKLTHVVLEKDL